MTDKLDAAWCLMKAREWDGAGYSINDSRADMQKMASALRIAARVLDEASVEGVCALIDEIPVDWACCDDVEIEANTTRAVLAYLRGDEG